MDFSQTAKRKNKGTTNPIGRALHSALHFSSFQTRIVYPQDTRKRKQKWENTNKADLYEIDSNNRK